MNKKYIVIAILIIAIIITVVIVNQKKNSNSNENQPIETVVNYKEETKEDGTTGYMVYDENTGRIIAEDIEESQIQMYKDDPNFVGSETINDMEIHDNPDIISGSVWESKIAE